MDKNNDLKGGYMRNILLAVLFFLSSITLNAKIKVVASSQDLKNIAEYIGGEEVSVESIADGNYDLHTIEPRPSMVIKIKNADAIIRIGLDLDMWMDSLIAASKNEKVMFSKPGYIDASKGIAVLEKPQGKVDGSMGDIHIFGNPHYWLDPENGKIIAKNIKEGLSRILPQKEKIFEENYINFCKQIDEKMKMWKEELSSLKWNRKMITYHNSWIYFARRFTIEIPMEIEPKPGIPPNPSHISRLIELIKKEDIKVIMIDNFYPLSTGKKLAKETGAKIVIVPSSVNGEKGVDDYFKLFDYIIVHIKKAVE